MQLLAGKRRAAELSTADQQAYPATRPRAMTCRAPLDADLRSGEARHRPAARAISGPITVLPGLLQPRIDHLRGDEFVITGNVPKPRGNLGERWPQAWWCRLSAPL
jgi:hypothetical protein